MDQRDKERLEEFKGGVQEMANRIEGITIEMIAMTGRIAQSSQEKAEQLRPISAKLREGMDALNAAKTKLNNLLS